MKTGNNNATNNVIVRFWSANHYKHKHNIQHNMFKGSVTNVKTKESKFFDSPGKMLRLMEQFYNDEEKRRG